MRRGRRAIHGIPDASECIQRVVELLTAIEFGPPAFAAAFAAGVVSFLSPCVLPLVPGYLSIVSGVGVGELGSAPRKVTSATIAFVGGFSTVFVLLGAGAALFGDLLLTNRRTLEIVAGILIVFAGLVFAGVPLPLPLLREKRVLGHRPRGGGVLTAALVGLGFGVGWTPCIGPTLAAILTLAAATGSAPQGAVLLAVYAIGLGIPFLAFGLAFTRALSVVGVLQRHRAAVGTISGSVLVVFGVLLATGYLGRLTRSLAQFTGLSI
ncbi:MAG: cytochrome C biogenesis protein CcdA [Gaiellaceae bacterium]|nr:MAG: cytochrome C biogenesis protein CcdA [Gaiellaceae bacterium]